MTRRMLKDIYWPTGRRVSQGNRFHLQITKTIINADNFNDKVYNMHSSQFVKSCHYFLDAVNSVFVAVGAEPLLPLQWTLISPDA